MIVYTTIAAVQAALGPSVPFAADPDAQSCVDAANDVITNKRAAAGYPDDDPLTPPGPGPARGATLYAVALWRQRQSTDTFASFDDFASTVQTGGTWPEIKRLCGIPRGRVDTPMSYADARAKRHAIMFPRPVVSP